jgi:hypothetical protein
MFFIADHLVVWDAASALEEEPIVRRMTDRWSECAADAAKQGGTAGCIPSLGGWDFLFL